VLLSGAERESFVAFPLQQWLEKTQQCYVLRKLRDVVHKMRDVIHKIRDVIHKMLYIRKMRDVVHIMRDIDKVRDVIHKMRDVIHKMRDVIRKMRDVIRKMRDIRKVCDVIHKMRDVTHKMRDVIVKCVTLYVNCVTYVKCVYCFNATSYLRYIFQTSLPAYTFQDGLVVVTTLIRSLPLNSSVDSLDKGNGKGKGHPITGHEGPEAE
jgi:uncharacterized protein YeeX (DUF496 family)